MRALALQAGAKTGCRFSVLSSATEVWQSGRPAAAGGAAVQANLRSRLSAAAGTNAPVWARERLVSESPRRCGRVVDCTGLENRQRATFREFESHRLRQMIKKNGPLRAVFYFYPSLYPSSVMGCSEVG